MKTDALNTKIDALSINAATKNDVATLKAEMEASTRTAIAEAVGPLETRVEALEATIASTGTSATTANSRDLSRVMERLSKLDPALKSITAIGFDVTDLQGHRVARAGCASSWTSSSRTSSSPRSRRS